MPILLEEALGLIEVEYEVLPPVLHVLDAMKDKAPLLHETMTTTELGQKTDKHSNIANHLRFLLGDPAQGFREADMVIEREFDTATVHQGYIEPHNATALWNEDGHLYIWTSTQGAFVVQRQAAEILGLLSVAGVGDAVRNRWRVWGQDFGLPRTGGRGPVAQGWPTRQNHHESH